MNLHEDIDFFKDAVSITAQHMGMPEVYVEKDYWVTLALRRIFTGATAQYTVFKGGTALSKCFTYINRFSEDIDLVLIKEKGLSANQLKARLKRLSETVSQVLPEIEVEGITSKKGMIRKTAHSYSRVFRGDLGQARDQIILESSWFGASEPTTTGKVASFISEMMAERDQLEMVAKYQLLPFEVNILAPERTLCEKIMSLVRFSYTDNPIRDLRNKIRHAYDLHQMLDQEHLSQFMDSLAFDTMIHNVGHDDELAFRNNKEWLYHHPSKALMFSNLEEVWSELIISYNGVFRTLVFGNLPDGVLVKKTMIRIKERLEMVDWKLQKQ